MKFIIIELLIIFILSTILLILLLSNLEIEIKELEIDTTKKRKNILVCLKLKLFNKIPIFKINIDNKKIKSLEIKNEKLVKSIISSQRENLKLNNLEILKYLDFNLEEINLKVIISLLEVMPTMLAIPILSSIISIIIEKTAKRYEKEKYKYSIKPSSNLNLMVKVKLKCIISIKVVNIINVIYIMLKKGSGKNNERASNRRSYVCNNDKNTRYGRC